MSLGERLRHVRNRHNLTLQEVESKTGIGTSSLSEFENDKREPSVNQLGQLAKVYKKPFEFFLSDEPVAQESILWRAEPSTPDKESIEERFLTLCQYFHELEMLCGEIKPRPLPKPELETEEFGYLEAEELARDVRNELELGDRPGCSLLRVLEEVYGVKIFHMNFEDIINETGFAASTVSDSFGASVLLNSRHVRWRRNFDLAHELFHILTWDMFRQPGEPVVKLLKEEEKLATCFAGNLLIPESVLRIMLERALRGVEKRSCTISCLFDIARQFDVSIDSLMWRIHFIFRGKGDTEQTKDEIHKTKAFSLLYETRISDAPPERPERFRILAERALNRGLISTGRFAEYMGISRGKAQTYARQESAEDEEIEIAPA